MLHFRKRAFALLNVRDDQNTRKEKKGRKKGTSWGIKRPLRLVWCSRKGYKHAMKSVWCEVLAQERGQAVQPHR